MPAAEEEARSLFAIGHWIDGQSASCSDGEPDDLSLRGYPVARGHWCSFGWCREYERKLSSARRAKPLFSSAVRFGTAPWTGDEAKLRHDEVLPLLAFAEHFGVVEAADFCVEQFGQDSVVDASIRFGKTCSSYQIVSAGMSWPLSDGRRSRHGNDRRNANEAMRDGRVVPGYSAFEKCDDDVRYDEMARPTGEIVEAFRLGVLDALANKYHRSTRRTLEINQHSVELLVYFGDVKESEVIFLGLFEKRSACCTERGGRKSVLSYPRVRQCSRLLLELLSGAQSNG